LSPTDQLFIMKGILQRYGGASVFRNHFAIRRYRATNDSFGNPLIFSLTERGFFSEVNNLLNAIAFGLLTRRRFLVDQTKFQGMAWSDFFTVDLSGSLSLLPVDPEWVITDVQSRHFKTVRDEVFERWQRGERFNIASLALEEVDIFTLRRKIAQLFCFRRTVCNFGWSIFDTSSFYGTKAARWRKIGLRPHEFVAIHIRRGDKIESYIDASGKLVIEGEKTPISTYIDLIRKFAPAINKLFVLTDDHAAMDELRSYAPKLGLFTLCPEDSMGYRNNEFLQRPLKDRIKAVERLLTDVQIASQSALFVGPFKSNVSRFVTNVHCDPGALHKRR
jgi:hypothetical protein